MTTSVKVNAVRASDVYGAWGGLGDSTRSSNQPVGMLGTDLVDGAALALLKSEWLAAAAGVVPFVPLPGGGMGVLTVGGALAQPQSAWPQPELVHLYLAGHRNAQALHASVHARRLNTPMLRVGNDPEQRAVWPVLDNAQQVAANPMIWVVVSAVGILATMAGAWYFTRTEEKRIEADTDRAKEAHAIGALSDIASEQLIRTGKVDPAIIAAIRTKPSTPGSWWPYVAAASGGAMVAGYGVYRMTQRPRRRR